MKILDGGALNTGRKPLGDFSMHFRTKFNLAVYISCLFLSGMIAAPLLHVQNAPISNSQIANRLDPSGLNHEFTIAQWNLIGPFAFSERDGSADNPNADKAGAQHDFLADNGHPEEGLTADAIASMCADGKHCHIHPQHGAVLNFEKIFPGMTYAVIYAATEVTSTADGYVGLEYDYNDGVKVWLNGSLLQKDGNITRRPFFKYYRFLPLHLRKGNNLLVMKVDQEKASLPDQPWGLVASLMPIDRMRDMWLEREDGAFLLNRLIKAGEPLHLPMLEDKALLAKISPMHISIADWSGTALVSKDIYADGLDEVKLPQLGDGYYTVTLQAGTHVLHDAFYLGDTDTVYNALRSIQLSTEPATQEYIQRDPIIQRYRILTSPKYSHPLNPEWQKKLMKVLNDGVKALHHSTDASWSKMPGMHLREFISKIDGTPQDYLLFLPRAIHGPLPLVILMPYAVRPQRPFLEGTFLSYMDYLITLQHAADASEAAVALINGRGTVGDAPIGEADAFEVLDDINNNYPIDKSRLYLYGNCEGGRRALLLAEHYPGAFAAVGVYGALLTGYGRDALNKHGDPLSLVQRLSSTPVILTQGEFDYFPPIAATEAFYQKLISIGSASEIDIITDGMHDQDGAMEENVIPLLVAHRNVGNSTPIAELADKARSKVHP